VTIELKSKGLAYVNGLSTLTSGTILAANGISLGAGANVVGTGAVSGAVSTVRGSRIEADGGKLVVGDSGSYVGFDSDGLLYTNANEVELLDRNESVLGSLTQLGDGSSGGTLRAANGMLLEQGKNLTGRGTVYGNFINQGHVYGDGSTTGEEIIFAAGSTVSGNGSFTNALFQGTYSPGNSPAITSLQNGGFAQSSTLLIEVGGTQAGSQYDQVQDASTLSLRGGSLNVVLTNSFVPTPGNSFEILRYGQLSGDFGAVNLPAFDNGLGWQRVTTGTAMTLVAAPSAVSINVVAGSKTLAAAGYSSLAYAKSLNKSGDGALVLNGPNTLAGPTTIKQGTVQLAHSSALSASTISPLAGGVLSLTPNLRATVGGLNPNAGGLVDVGTGMVTVANGLTPTALVTALQSGRAGGSWTGSSGITSSAAASALASTTLRSVGWLDNGNGSVMFGYAATGDTNLDWVIDILDVANFVDSGKFNSGLTTTWAEGDFNYDGFVDILDMADFVSTGLFDTGPYNAPAGTIAAVPEPSVLGLVGVGAGVVGLVAVRRKRAA
jgi:autotransporter-associated beta strand protein